MGPLAEITVAGERYAIRRAIGEDLGAILALMADDQLGAVREGGDLAPYVAAFAQIDADASQLLVVVVTCRGDDSDAVVATLQLTFIPGLARRGSLRAQVEAVRVAEALRGAGLGGELMRWAVEESRRRGCSLVQLTSDKRRVEAHRFYGRLGFVASHEGFKLRLGGD